MANAGGMAGGAASGALAGSALGPYGMAAGAIIGLLGSALSGNDNSQEIQQRLAENNRISAENENQYTHSLIAEAMRRSGASTRDDYGTATDYDPATNTWKTHLGGLPRAVQDALYTANLSRGADVQRASATNDQAGLQEAVARRHLSGAGNTLANYQDLSPDALRADMMDATLRGNDAVFRPLMQETMRQASRTGSAAGPLISDVGRTQADLVAKQMAENAVNSRASAAQINATNRGALGNTFQAFNQGTQVQRNYPGLPSTDPNAQIQQALATRQAGLGQPASLGAYGGAARTGALTEAAKLNIGYPGGNNKTAGLLSNLGREGGNFLSSLGQEYTGSDGSNSSIWGDIKSLFSNNTIPEGIYNGGASGISNGAGGFLTGLNGLLAGPV